MLDGLIIYIKSIIIAYGGGGVFVATILEEIITPIPSPLIPLTAGFFLLPQAHVPIITVIATAIIKIALPVTLGISVGATVIYWAGYWGGKPLIEKIKTWTRFSWQDLAKAEKRLTGGKGDEIALLILRLLPIIPGVAVSGFCGLIRYPYKKFLLITIAGVFTRALVLSLIGWQVGEVYEKYALLISHGEKYLLMIILAGLAVTIMVYLLKKRQ